MTGDNTDETKRIVDFGSKKTTIEYYRCPWCGKTLTFNHECLTSVTARITKMAGGRYVPGIKPPPDVDNNRWLLVSLRCDRIRCGQDCWVEMLHKKE